MCLEALEEAAAAGLPPTTVLLPLLLLTPAGPGCPRRPHRPGGFLPLSAPPWGPCRLAPRPTSRPHHCTHVCMLLAAHPPPRTCKVRPGGGTCDSLSRPGEPPTPPYRPCQWAAEGEGPGSPRPAGARPVRATCWARRSPSSSSSARGIARQAGVPCAGAAAPASFVGEPLFGAFPLNPASRAACCRLASSRPAFIGCWRVAHAAFGEGPGSPCDLLIAYHSVTQAIEPHSGSRPSPPPTHTPRFPSPAFDHNKVFMTF